MKDLHVSYDILGLGVEDDKEETANKFVIRVDRDDGEVYDIPPNAPVFNNVYVGSTKKFD